MEPKSYRASSEKITDSRVAPGSAMNTDATAKITPQAAGAFGEKAVEAELLRNNWIPANVNRTLKNAEDYDIFALKGDRWIKVRVKTCRPGMRAFLYGGFAPGQPIQTTDIKPDDFTIVVRMGQQRQDDRFYVVPTIVVWKEISKRQSEHAERGAREIGMWRLRFNDRKDGREEGGVGIERKWGQYEGVWELLDVGMSTTNPARKRRCK
jgi:hypothetical protein